MLDVKALDQIDPGTRLVDLSKTRLLAVQRGLAICAYPVGYVDGLHGPRTRNAFAELVAEEGLGDAEIVSEQAIEHLKSKVYAMRALLEKPAESADVVKERLAEAFRLIGLRYKAHIAYGIATAQWETNHTFSPVKEAYWLSENWRKNNFIYYPYYGRGYVQLTWERNYDLYSGIVGLNLTEEPDFALRHDVSLFVIAHGMKMGSFTGRKLEDYITRNKIDFVNARRVINGVNKSHDIAALAESYMNHI